MSSTMCPICLEEDVAMFALDCDHTFCYKCLCGYIRERVSENESTILCPCGDCDLKIGDDALRDILEGDEELYDDYQRMCDDEISSQQLTASICTECGRVCHKSDYNNRVTCHRCNISFCFVCKKSHDEYNAYTCYEVNEDLEEFRYCFDEDLFKQCPLCKIGIYKESGCSAIRCKNCKIKFCWDCMKTNHQIGQLKNHRCRGFDAFLHNSSDDEYSDGDGL